MIQKYLTEEELRRDLKAHLLQEANNLSASLKKKKVASQALEHA